MSATVRIACLDGLRNDRSDYRTVAVGREIRDLERLRRIDRPGYWRKLKGIATIRLTGGKVRLAELTRVPRRTVWVRRKTSASDTLRDEDKEKIATTCSAAFRLH